MPVGQSHVVYKGVKSVVSNIAQATGVPKEASDMIGCGAGMLAQKPVAFATLDIVGTAASTVDCLNIGKKFRDSCK